MNKKAIIIGCSGKGDNYLPGVKKDVENFRDFLQSSTGGVWYSSEVVTLLDQSKESIESTLYQLRQQHLDFSFVVFTGHGDYSTHENCRRLWVDNEKFIYEKSLRRISQKQVLVIDSCAGKVNDIPQIGLEAFKNESRLFTEAKRNYRAEYESAIRQCPPQEIRLYSCDIDESSSDTSKGGLYSKNLLMTAYNNTKNNVLSSLIAHERASISVINESDNEQNPQYYCSAKNGSKLPLSLMS